MFRAIGRRIEAWLDRHFIGFSVTGLFLLFIFVYFAESIFITVPPGHGGALWLRFFGGTVMNFQFSEGMKVIPPWDRIYIYDLRVQQEHDKFDVLTKEGLQITIDATLRFRLNPEALGPITSYAGPDFVRTLIMPTVGATIRSKAAVNTLDEIFALKRRQIEEEITKILSEAVDNLILGAADSRPEIIVQDFWFRSIVLPENLRMSIEAKLTQRQLSEQYVYILDRERQEKERKVIEAEGIKAFQDIVSSGISENYLRWKGIDATLKLAESTNSKIVIVGSGKDGLPLILGPWDSTTPRPGPTPPAPAPEQGSRGAPPAPAQNPERSSGGPSSFLPPIRTIPGIPPAPLAMDPHISMPAAPMEGPLSPDALR